MITYRLGNDIGVEEFIDLLHSCTLGERRPLDDRNRMARMLQNANLVVTAWDDSLLVGIARSMTDFGFATYLSDLAVRESHQRMGIGKELMRRTQQAAPQAVIILMSAPDAVDYYPHVGFAQHQSAWYLKPGESIG